MKQYVVTISRQFGSLGRTIAQRLSETLQIDFYDRDIVEEIETKRRWLEVKNIIENMEDEREKEIIILRYGLNNAKPLTQREVAQRLNISRSYVSRIEKKILQDLKKKVN